MTHRGWYAIKQNSDSSFGRMWHKFSFFGRVKLGLNSFFLPGFLNKAKEPSETCSLKDISMKWNTISLIQDLNS